MSGFSIEESRQFVPFGPRQVLEVHLGPKFESVPAMCHAADLPRRHTRLRSVSINTGASSGLTVATREPEDGAPREARGALIVPMSHGKRQKIVVARRDLGYIDRLDVQRGEEAVHLGNLGPDAPRMTQYGESRPVVHRDIAAVNPADSPSAWSSGRHVQERSQCAY